jgi:hypothetical protein
MVQQAARTVNPSAQEQSKSANDDLDLPRGKLMFSKQRTQQPPYPSSKSNRYLLSNCLRVGVRSSIETTLYNFLWVQNQTMTDTMNRQNDSIKNNKYEAVIPVYTY